MQAAPGLATCLRRATGANAGFDQSQGARSETAGVGSTARERPRHLTAGVAAPAPGRAGVVRRFEAPAADPNRNIFRSGAGISLDFVSARSTLCHSWMSSFAHRSVGTNDSGPASSFAALLLARPDKPVRGSKAEERPPPSSSTRTPIRAGARRARTCCRTGLAWSPGSPVRNSRSSRRLPPDQ